MTISYQISQDFHYEMGFRLKQARQAKNVSQEQLAKAIGIAKQTIQKYETGEIKMPVELIYLCSKYFNVPTGYFYGEGGSKSNNQIEMVVASEIMLLPNQDIVKAIYSLVKVINTSFEKIR